MPYVTPDGSTTVVSSVLPTGASTEATQLGVATSVGSIDSKINPLLRDPDPDVDSGISVRAVLPLRDHDITGNLSVSESTPILALNFNYSVNNTETSTNVTNTTGSVSQAASMAVLQTGTGAAGSAQVESKGAARYISGVGVQASYSTVFTTGVANSQQEAGLGDLNDGQFVGYQGNVFGIFLRIAGVDTFVPQSSWNYDKCDGTGPSGYVLDPTKIQIWRNGFLWHGAGPLHWRVYDGTHWILIHAIVWANTHSTVHLTNPNLPLHFRVVNSGNTNNITMKVGSAGAAIQGKDATGGLPIIGTRGSAHAVKSVASPTEAAVLTIQNKATNVLGGTNTNRTRVKITGFRMQTSTAGGNTGLFRLVRGATLGGSPSYTDYDTNTSVMSFDVAGTTLTGGRELYSQSLNGGNNDSIVLTDANILLNPGDIVTASVALSAGGASNQFVSISWIEFT